MAADIGIDLGTASILVYVKGKGVILKEPSVVAFDRDSNEVKAIGEEARLMLGRTPGNIVAIRPLRQGVISDYTVTEKMIKYFVQKALGRRTFKKPRISMGGHRHFEALRQHDRGYRRRDVGYRGHLPWRHGGEHFYQAGGR